MKPRMTEEQLAEQIILSLEEWGWAIYQEVLSPTGVIDIVANRGFIQWSIECKVSFGIKVIDQAFKRQPYCHYSSIAVPKITNEIGRIFCRQNGIGIITLRGYDGRAEEQVKPSLNRKPLLVELNDHQKTICKAGSKGGGHWTPFKQTCMNLVDSVKRNEGMEFGELIKRLDHHYSSYGSARSCLLGFIGTVIPELRTEIVDRKLCVFLADNK